MKITIPFLIVFQFMLNSMSTCAAKGGQDISTGIAFPSDNSATYENASVLGSSNSSGEGLVGLDDADLQAVYAGGTGGIGIGLGVQRLNKNLVGLAGLGFGLGSTSLGADLSYQFENDGLSIDAGLITSALGVFRFAFVVTDITNDVGSLIAGIGQDIGTLVFEGDIAYNTNSENWTLLPSILIRAIGKKLSLMVGLIVPLSDNGNTDFKFGISYWLGGNFMLEYLHDVILDKNTIGIKIPI